MPDSRFDGRYASDLGRRVFGAAAFTLGVVTLVWHDYRDSDQLRHLLNASAGPVFVYALGAAQVVGGAALQFRRTAKMGAILVGAVYLALAVLCVPRIVAATRVYNNWGNFFEMFSIVTGAGMVYASSSSARRRQPLYRIGRILFGFCVASFGIEQAVYFGATAELVPKWIPPSQTFWAAATTVFFALAALALLTGRLTVPATRLLTLMLVSFGVLVWIPLVLSHPHSHANWSELAETFAIAGAAWILADRFGVSQRPRQRGGRFSRNAATPSLKSALP